ncbi:MAG: sigma-54-dependent Fis family transcriptional regulator [Desulfobacteraceae bacterium]|nr:sigma-54-dependent Fis family transcriptional regulator [Desulfobacteraceae bacterium]
MVKILAIDDDDIFCYAIKRLVRSLGHEFFDVPTIADALKIVCENEFDLVLLDVGLPDGNGLDILPALKEGALSPEVVIITGAGDVQGAQLAIENGAWDYIEKTDSTKKISLIITRVLQYRAERKKSLDSLQVKYLKRESIIGTSPKMKLSLDLVAKAAACDANVLITGETGTGKELFANAIHVNSPRASHDLVTIDCAALPENLAENLLFGHKKGVYTGADGNSCGLIKMADGGSLFLDEIAELSLPLQKTFLRVLQERKFRPLGEVKEIKSDFRLIAATNKNLDTMVEKGQFRKDLLFRIRSLRIQLPRLCERDGDIKKLARYYLDFFCDKLMRDSKGVSSDFFDVLNGYFWPGNVRELSNTMEHVVMAALNEPTVFPTHLPQRLRLHVVKSNLTGGQKESPAWKYPKDKIPPLAEFRELVNLNHEKKYLMDLMNQAPCIKQACITSGLSRSRLYAILKTHGMSLPKKG